MIACKHFSFDIISEFSSKDKDYQINPQKFADFIEDIPSLNSFPQAISKRKDSIPDRSLLVSVIRQGYQVLPMTDAQRLNLEKLEKENCFTITTAHQPSLLTGPLYFIYKIISTIILADKAQKKFNDFNFVPVFVMGGEDHDFEEINHVRIFNNTIIWQNEEGGAVGRMGKITLTPILEALKEILGSSDHASDLFKMVEFAYSSSNTYGEFMHLFVNQLLGEYGIIVLNMDNPALKSAFVPVMEREILENISYPLVLSSQEKMATLGYKPQAHVREINLFYLTEQARERIVLDNGKYKVLNSAIEFTSEELIEHLRKMPERFSPNVVLRPLYQEFILPNLVYIGGGGELAYWMERKTQFEAFGIPFPLLYRRDSVIWVQNRQYKVMQGYNIELESLLSKTEDELINAFVKENAAIELNFDEEESHLRYAYDILVNKANSIDPTLAKAIRAEEVKQNKQFQQLAGRLVRTLKHKQENETLRIRKLKSDIFPDHGLQERTENFIPYYLKYGKRYFEILLSTLDPEIKSLKVIIEQGDN